MHEDLQVIDKVLTRAVKESGLVESVFLSRRKKDPVKQDLLQRRKAAKSVVTHKKRVKQKQETKRVILGGGVVGAGITVTKPYSKGMLTGRETLFHGTRKANVASIRRRGLRASQAAREGSLTQNVMPQAANNKHFKGLVYASKSRSGAVAANMQRFVQRVLHGKSVVPGKIKIGLAYDKKKTPQIRNSKLARIWYRTRRLMRRTVVSARDVGPQQILKLKIPIDKMKIVDNPELKHGNLNFVPKFQRKQAERQLGSRGTAVMKGSVSPRYIVGSKYYQRTTPKEVLKHIRKRPGKFALGAAITVGSGVGALALGKATWKQHKKTRAAGKEYKGARKDWAQARKNYRAQYNIFGRKRKIQEVVDSFYGPSALHVGKGSVTPRTLVRGAKAQGIRQWRKEVKKPFKGVRMALRHRKKSIELFKQGRLGKAIRKRSLANAVLKNRAAPIAVGSAVWTGMSLLPGQTTAAVASTKIARKMTKALRSRAVRKLGSL